MSPLFKSTVMGSVHQQEKKQVVLRVSLNNEQDVELLGHSR